MAHSHIIVHGLVQGVGFRYYALRQAQALQIGGWARNLADGTVEIDADGPADHLQSFIDAIREGPRFSRVTRLDVAPLPEIEPRRDFRITG